MTARLNSLIMSCRHVAGFGHASGVLIGLRRSHVFVHGYALNRTTPYVTARQVFEKTAMSLNYEFKLDFHTSFILSELEVISSKSSTSSIPMPPTTGIPLPNSSDKSQTASLKEPTPAPVASQSPGNNPQKAVEPKKPKKSFLVKFKEELIHYYHGFRLLGLETIIAGGICLRLLTGKTLTRRERNQLVRTVADIFRLVPFAVFIIVPFMELLLPVYLKFFPFMLPSTFKEKGKEEEKVRQRLKAKLEVARFLQETVMQTTTKTSKSKDIPTIVEFQEFLKTVRQSGQLADTTDILRFSRLFEDQVTLDSLDHAQLKALCQLLEINSIGPSNFLRFQLWLRVRQLRTEDKLIAKEGVDQIPSWELQSLSRSRGMRSLGLTEGRLRSQLNQWLELHLEKNVPITLLLLSRAMYLQDTTLPPERQLQHAISVLPDKATEEAAVKAVESTEDVDPKTKMELLRKEQETIKAERAAARKAAEGETHKVVEVGSQDPLVDKAKPLEFRSSEELKDAAEKLVGKSLQESLEPIVPPVKPSQTSYTAPETVTHAAESMSTGKASTAAPPPIATPVGVETKETSKTHEEEPMVSSKDLDSIKAAIGSMEESKKALQEEHLLDLKADLDEAVKLRQQQQKESEKAEIVAEFIKEGKETKDEMLVAEAVPKSAPPPPPRKSDEEKIEAAVGATAEVKKKIEAEEVPEMTPREEAEAAAKAEVKEKMATKKAAKTEKAVKRLGAHVDRLLDEIDGLVDKLRGQKQDLLEEIRAHGGKAKAIETEADEERRKQLFENIRADQQRVVDINDVLVSLQRLQKASGSDAEAVQRWQLILEALDEDHDGKIEFKHLLAVLEMFEKEKVELNTSQLSDVVEMFEKEDLLEEQEGRAGETKEATNENSETSQKAPGTSKKVDSTKV
ncbi:LETM1 and EF-hand domain-containing protein 1, mitochondrial [Echinococcus granulosus]|nr:LETM1 and EF-hand domain-containing protein 1, mitochondrial [Echinococcus granulosus]